METPNETPRVYSQAEVDQLKKEHSEQMDARAEEARTKIAIATKTVNPDAFLASDQQKDNAAEVERKGLNKYFGKGANGKLANDLARENPTLYQALKLRAQACGLIGKPLTLPQVTSKQFRGNE